MKNGKFVVTRWFLDGYGREFRAQTEHRTLEIAKKISASNQFQGYTMKRVANSETKVYIKE